MADFAHDRVRDLLDDVSRRMSTFRKTRDSSGHADQTTGNGIAEIEARFTQIDWACHEIRNMEENHFRTPWIAISLDPNKTRFDQARTDLLALRFMVEGVYMAAWQVREVCQRIKALKFDANGLRYVRNQLIVHPTKPDGVYSWSYAIGMDGNGLTLAVARSDGDLSKQLDAGFWPNLEEFLLNFDAKLRQL
ncbi:hypothetical protein [Rhizobium sp. FKY42]|uniref:hypothetical protein n=1 Tax=Rhizobium sp. FKY42 TaxID=2562310 RepID=UPI0010C10093|nr:hypothetical protein [Rhizobium sp. FKY42]